MVYFPSDFICFYLRHIQLVTVLRTGIVLGPVFESMCGSWDISGRVEEYFITVTQT